MISGTEGFDSFENPFTVTASRQDDRIEAADIPQLIHSLFKSPLDISKEVLIYRTELSGHETVAVVKQKEFTVRHAAEQLRHPHLGLVINGEMWGDHIIIIRIQILVKVMFQLVNIGIVKDNLYLSLIHKRIGKRVHKQLLENIHAAKYHQDVKFLRNLVRITRDIIAFTGTTGDIAFVTKGHQCTFYRFF